MFGTHVGAKCEQGDLRGEVMITRHRTYTSDPRRRLRETRFLPTEETGFLACAWNAGGRRGEQTLRVTPPDSAIRAVDRAWGIPPRRPPRRWEITRRVGGRPARAKS